MADLAPTKRPFHLLCGGAGVLTVAWLLGLQLGGDAPRDISNFGLIGVSAAAGVAALLRSAQSTGRSARFWTLLGAAALTWATGQVIWTWIEMTRGTPDEPTLADAFYLGALPLFALAILAMPLAATTLAARLRSVLDGLIIAASLFLISYTLVLEAVLTADSAMTLDELVLAAYPLGDVVTITLILYTMSLTRRGVGRLPAPLLLVALGLVAICVSDSGYAYLAVANAPEVANGLEVATGYTSGHPIDLGWFVGYLLILLAARFPGLSEDVKERSELQRSHLSIALPYLAVTGAVVVSIIDLLGDDGTGDAFSFGARTAIIVLLMVRQVLVLLENHRLTGDLEARVASRTAQLAASEQRFAALVQHSSDVVTIVDAEGIVQYQSASSQRVFGYAPEDLMGRCITQLIDGAEEERAFHGALRECAGIPLHVVTSQTCWRDTRGAFRLVEVTITNLLDDPAVEGLVLNSRDVTDRKVLEEKLLHQAYHDSLTSLPNRALFTTRIERAVAHGGGRPGTVGVLFMDLDGFKEINDNLGHSTGDELLRRVAQRLRAAVRPADVIARLGGDEFAILVEDIAGEHILQDLADRILDELAYPMLLAGQELHIRASIGIAARSDELEDAEQLLRNADLAMYRAKSAGGGGFSRFAPEMHADTVERFRVETELRRALDLDELELYYQPMIDLRGGHITGVEALVRWRHPERGLISPDQFIPFVETTALIHPLGDWVLHEACRQTAEWQRSSPLLQDLQINVNMSPRQLLQLDLPDRIADVLHATGLAPRSLVLEMTESILMDHSDDTMRSLHALKQLGVRLAIDDFGTGYSSLSYLHRFPVDVLKIDRSFVERMGTDADLVSTIIQLGRAMRLEIVAEGIEEHDQFSALRRLGCTTGQGFHISRPLPSDQITGLLAEWALGDPIVIDRVEGLSLPPLRTTRADAAELPAAGATTDVHATVLAGARTGVPRPDSTRHEACTAGPMHETAP
jgi:diguanylate cyclase (GGDEF)-like protein/PAS domain S-box-containing protein